MGSNIDIAMNPWEREALNFYFPDDNLSAAVDIKAATVPSKSRWQEMPHSAFYPGLYSASGYDLMTILFRLMCRPNPQVELGPVDCSVALVLCDLELPDEPIVYATDAFCDLTGYSKPEILGRNCRFLQANNDEPKGNPSAAPEPLPKTETSRIRQAIDARKEIQINVVNYRKNGEIFNNLLSIIPLTLDDSGYQYAVGFAVEVP
ncbi:hypothetical protein E4U42_005615 [Claviceps africana]|uniref:PAS domain-containing protein n=1 Tax=Claviceps africana TaxID=83212 RepID=A0A8K0J417_9HYPO|nr:hypothetical protein E4U42_005615 [Claviceps africana]